MSALQMYANDFVTNGWTISSMTEQQFIATRRQGMNCLVALLGIAGLFFFLIPGLLILLLGYSARGTDTVIVTSVQADAWLAKKEQQAKTLRDEAIARKIANDKKIAELSLSGSPLRFWYMLSSDQKGVLIFTVIIVLSIVLLQLLKSIS